MNHRHRIDACVCTAHDAIAADAKLFTFIQLIASPISFVPDQVMIIPILVS